MADTDGEDENENEPNKEIICAALLTSFYCGNMTQHCLKIVIELLQGLTKIKIPKTFDQLMSVIEQDALSYNKVWFCLFHIYFIFYIYFMKYI